MAIHKHIFGKIATRLFSSEGLGGPNQLDDADGVCRAVHPDSAARDAAMGWQSDAEGDACPPLAPVGAVGTAHERSCMTPSLLARLCPPCGACVASSLNHDRQMSGGVPLSRLMEFGRQISKPEFVQLTTGPAWLRPQLPSRARPGPCTRSSVRLSRTANGRFL